MFSCKTRIGERSFSSLTSDLLDFHTNKTEQYLQKNLFCALMNHHALLAIQAKLKLANFYHFSVVIDSRAKSLQKCGKSGETLKFWNAAISKYIQLIFYYVMWNLLIFNISKIWTGVMWSTLKISSRAQLGHDKRDIPAFDTVLFHSNLSSLRRKYFSDVTTDNVVLSCSFQTY